ncbi:DUF7408 domain-containing protein [Paenibacillus dokdonensis]|uniref:DUF7408 domain-containing protein n=1 Tax=Paenibacillus dokdonensis TaxID=2567944 RepID=UPI0010A87851|nr:hypothetical protein [Paenibacillus dokdonensis]
MLSLIKRDMKRTRLPLWAVAILLLLQLGLGTGIAHADDKPSIIVKSEAGYSGMIKNGTWNPLKLTLTSNQDLSGDIVFQVLQNQFGNSPSSYVQHVELPKDTPKEVVLAIPGQQYNKNNNTVRFYEGSVEKGKLISFSNGTDSYINGATINSTNVGVLSDDPDAMNFLGMLQSGNSKISVMHMKQKDISEDPMLMDGLDVLVFDRFASDTLTPAQVKSIEQWVKTGGKLILGGGAAYPKTAAPFAEISPVKYKGTFSVTSLPELEKLGAFKQGSAQGGAAKLNLGGELTLSDAELVKDAKLMYTTGGKPLFASRQVENGKVLYAAYDVAQEPIASWAGHPSVWSALLGTELQTNNLNAMRGNYNPLMNLSYILNFFPSLKMPSFQVLAWLIVIYAVVVAPLLYLLLKRVDKREWAWWMIPLIAVIASGTVYFIGASDKTKELAHTLNVVELDGRGQGKVKSATAFFSPGSGDYHLELPANSYVTIQRDGGSFSGSADSLSLVEVGSKETGVELLDMPQWSLAKLWVEQRSQNEGLGQLEVSLFINDKGDIDGKVVNTTSKNLTHAGLVVGGKLYPLGDLEQGKSISLASVKNAQAVRNGMLSFAMFQNNSGGQDPYNRERGMLDNYLQGSAWSAQDAYIVAFSKDKLFNYRNDGRDIDSDQLNLWLQPVDISWTQNGKVKIPLGFITPIVNQVASPNWYEQPNGISHIEQGYITFDYDVTDMKKMTGGMLKLQAKNPGKQTEYYIFNYKKQDWELIKWDASKQWSAANPNDQYASQGRIRIKLTAKEATELMLPELAVEGAVKP